MNRKIFVYKNERHKTADIFSVAFPVVVLYNAHNPARFHVIGVLYTIWKGCKGLIGPPKYFFFHNKI